MTNAALREHVLYLLDGGACTSPINRRAERNNPIPQTRVRDRVVGWKLSLQRRFNREVAQTAWGSWNLRSLKMLVEVFVGCRHRQSVRTVSMPLSIERSRSDENCR